MFNKYLEPTGYNSCKDLSHDAENGDATKVAITPFVVKHDVLGISHALGDCASLQALYEEVM